MTGSGGDRSKQHQLVYRVRPSVFGYVGIASSCQVCDELAVGLESGVVSAIGLRNHYSELFRRVWKIQTSAQGWCLINFFDLGIVDDKFLVIGICENPKNQLRFAGRLFAS